MLGKLKKIKGVEFKNLAESVVSSDYAIKDLPLNLRAQNITSQALNHLDDFDKVFISDKLFLLNKVLNNVSLDYLKHLNVFINANLKTLVNFENKIISDALIIRHNRIFLIQFSYNFVSFSQFDMGKAKVEYVLKSIEQELKLRLPYDTQIETFVFDIGDVKANENVIKRLSNRINKFYGKTTNRELLKIIE